MTTPQFGFARTLAAAAAILGVAMAGAASPAQAEPETYVIDPNHLSLGFLIDHIGYKRQLGQFLEGSGTFTYDPEANVLHDLRVEVDTASVFSNNERRDGHVRSADFLDTEAHPLMTFVATSSQAETATTGTVTGDLTLRGVTRPLTLEVTKNKAGLYPFGGNYVMGISARGQVKRSDFGMTYAIDNGWVGDEVDIIIELEAIRQSPIAQSGG